MDLNSFKVPVRAAGGFIPASFHLILPRICQTYRTVGQGRAVDAIKFGLAIKTHGYNMYLAGQSGTGKMSTVKDYLVEAAAAESVPPDWCYLYNFADNYRPIAVSFPPGGGARFAKELDDFIENAKREIPRAFESENYDERRQEVVKR